MLKAFRSIPALLVIFKTNIEFTVDSCEALNDAQREAFERKLGTPSERIYRALPLEPNVIEKERTKELHSNSQLSRSRNDN